VCIIWLLLVLLLVVVMVQGPCCHLKDAAAAQVHWFRMVYWQSLYTSQVLASKVAVILRRYLGLRIFELLLLLIHLQQCLLWDVCVAAAAVASLL
jgi:hypothetical protein